MKTFRFLLATLLLTAFVGSSLAIEITLTPIADSTVDAINPDTIDNNGALLTAAAGGFDQPAETLSFIYTQFMLPDGLTGLDIGAVNSVDLQFSRANPNVALSLTYYAYGVFDGFDFGSADDYTWNDGIGFYPENTNILNFSDPLEIPYYSDPGESSFIGTLSVSSAGDPAAPFGLNAAQTEPSRVNFRNLFLNDTDGKITIYTKVRQNFAVTSLAPLESIEDVHPITAAPMLILDYSEKVFTPGDFDEDGDVDGKDYLIWQQGGSHDPLSSSDLAEWEANYGAGTDSLSSLVAVPEPASFTSAVIGLLWFCRRRKR